MVEVLKKLYLAGLGAFAITKEKIESLADELIKKGEISSQEKKTFVEDLLETAQKTREEAQNFIQKEVKRILNTLNLPTRDEIEQLKKRLDELVQKIKQ